MGNKFEHFKTRILNSSGHEENFQIAIEYGDCSYDELTTEERIILQDMLNDFDPSNVK